MSYRNCDTIFTESQETNKNLNLSTPPIKKIFQSNEITFPQTLNRSNFQTPQTKNISLCNSEHKSFLKFQSQNSIGNINNLAQNLFQTNTSNQIQEYVSYITYNHNMIKNYILNSNIIFKIQTQQNLFYQLNFIIGLKKLNLVIVRRVNVLNYIVIVLQLVNYVHQNVIVVVVLIILQIQQREINLWKKWQKGIQKHSIKRLKKQIKNWHILKDVIAERVVAKRSIVNVIKWVLNVLIIVNVMDAKIVHQINQ
ncbi:unnamed protein product [Paramecium pentaurelia]|uniref:Transmembrane protein n=1 Tax=Paramecium pentaurelia TaxID=43138 RepID=A0A8S1XN50_9CILI|nr:unnamed protein product [Paramecium pentaurelia]